MVGGNSDRVLTSLHARDWGITAAALLALSGAFAPPASAQTLPAAPTNFTAAPGDAQVVLSWDAPASDSGVTRHEYRYRTTPNYPADWTQIANSAVGGANEAGYTVTGLTNETAHTFELRAVSAGGNSAAAESGPVTPTPGICGRTQQVQDLILKLTRVSDCAAVTVARLATVTRLDLNGGSITSLKTGDFAGLTAVTLISLGYNQLSALPANLFSGLTSLETLYLDGNQLTSLPADTFSGLTALTVLLLSFNGSLGSLPADLFSGLTRLDYLGLQDIGMTTLPAGLFSGLSAVTHINIRANAFRSLPAGVFSGLSNLRWLNLHATELGAVTAGAFSDLTELGSLRLSGNALSSLPSDVFSRLTKLELLFLADNNLSALPDGLFSGLTRVRVLQLGGNDVDPLPLAVTVEKVGSDRVRAKVLAGAPFAVEIPVTVANGTLDGGATALSVAAGSVEGTPVTVTRTAGTTAAVTVDVDLATQPTLPSDNTGYEFARASSGLPVTILPEAEEDGDGPPEEDDAGAAGA